MNGITYQPKGSMCMACTMRNSDCSDKPFNAMPVIKKDGKVNIVKCTYFKSQATQNFWEGLGNLMNS